MKRLRRPSLVEWLTLVMLVLVPVLAVLQYRWLGRVSEAERDLLTASLNAATSQFRLAFDVEVSGVYDALHMDSETYAERAWDRYGERYEQWRRASAHPRIVRAVYLLERSLDGEPAAMRFDAATRAFAPAAAPPEVGALVRPAPPDALADPGVVGRVFGFTFSPTDASLPALVIPVPPERTVYARPHTPKLAFVVVLLDREALANELLPELAERFFSAPGGPVYDIAVRDASPGGATVFATAADRPASEGDASAPLFDLAPGAAAPSSVVRIVGADAAGGAVEVTPRELSLLRYFVERRGEVVTRNALLDAVWGYSSTVMTRTVDVHVALLRQKLEETPRHPRYILTVHGTGYKFAG